MMFLPVALLFVAVCLAIIGYRHHHDMFKNLAIVLVIAAIGTTIITLLAISVS